MFYRMKKITALLLAMLMVFNLMPVSVLAEGAGSYASPYVGAGDGITLLAVSDAGKIQYSKSGKIHTYTVPVYFYKEGTTTIIDSAQLTLSSNGTKEIDLRNAFKDKELASMKVATSVSDSGTSLRFLRVSGSDLESKTSGGWLYQEIKNYEKKAVYIALASTELTVRFDLNGGNGTAPAAQTVEGAGQIITLPGAGDMRRDNHVLLGWSPSKDANAVGENLGPNGTNGKAEIYPLDGLYTVTQSLTLYAVWAQNSGTKAGTITVAVRKDGTVPGEPSIQNASYSFLADATNVSNVLDYFRPAQTVAGAATVHQALTPAFWSTFVTPNLNKLSNFDPDTQEIVFYVIKYQKSDGKWHIDGVIRDKSKVHLDYDGNGNTGGLTPDGVEVAAGTSVTVADAGNHYQGQEWRALTRTGYEFIGWNTRQDGKGAAYQPGASILVSGNMTLYAQWRPLTNNITFTYTGDVPRGAEAPDDQYNVPYESAQQKPVDPEGVPGYLFEGWTTSDVEVDEDGGYTMPNSNVAWTGNWIIDESLTKTLSATVDYWLDNDVQTDERVELTATVQILQPDTLSTADVTEKVFPGWKLDHITINSEKVESLPAAVDSGAAIVYHYVPNAFPYTVKFYKDAVSDDQYIPGADVAYDAAALGTALENLTYSAEIAAASCPEGYQAMGMVDPANSLAAITADIERNVIRVVLSRRTGISYTVTYLDKATDKELAKAKTVNGQTFGEEATENALPITGYTADEASKTITIAAENNEIVFYYTINRYDVTYFVEGVQDGDVESHDFGTTVALRDEPVRDGYAFSGWAVQTPAGLALDAASFTMPAGDVKLVGSFTAKTDTRYTVEHYQQNLSDNGYTLVEADTEIKVGATDAAAQYTAKNYEGFTYQNTPEFVSRKDQETILQSSAILGDGSLVVKLYYTRNTYQVTYAYRNAPEDASALPAEAAYRAGDTVTLVPVPATVPGYTFHGWHTPDDIQADSGRFVMPARDVEITGEWTKNGTITLKLADAEATYNGLEQTLSLVEVTVDGLKAEEALTFAQVKERYGIALTLTNGAGKDAGDYAGGISGTAQVAYMGGIYDVTYANGTLAIIPAPLTVTTGSAGKTYDGTALTSAEIAMEGLVNGETVTGTATGSQTEVGVSDNTYTLAWGAVKASNYAITGKLGTLTVTEYADEITVTTTGGEFTYDGQPHGATVTVSELPKGYMLETALSGAAATDVTAEAVTATCDTLIIRNAAGENVTGKLNIRKVDGSITVNPARIMVSAEDTRAYTGADQTLDIGAFGNKTVTGVAAGETLALTGATVTGNAAGEYTLGEDAGYTWFVTKADGTASTGNYTIEVAGKLTISREQDLAVALDDLNHVYDGRAHFLEAAAVTSAGGTTTLRYSTDRANWYDSIEAAALGLTDVGEVMIYVQAANPNYSNTAETSAVLKVTPRPVTITANSQTDFVYDGTAKQAVGADNKLYTVSATDENTGIVDGHDLAVTVLYDGEEAQTNVGVYSATMAENAVRISVGGVDVTANYDIRLVPGTLSIAAAAARELMVTSYEGDYDAESHSVTVDEASLVDGDRVFYSLTGGADAADWTESNPARTDAQPEETVYVKVENPNYQTRYGDATITITPLTITVTAEEKSKVYGEVDPALTYEVSAAAGQETPEFAGALTRAAGEDVNTYAIEQGMLALVDNGGFKASNYALSFVPASFTITPRPVTITANDGEHEYDGHEKTGALANDKLYTIQLAGEKAAEGLLGGHAETGVTVRYDDAASQRLAGNYHAVASGASIMAGEMDVSANYAISYVNGTLKINSRTAKYQLAMVANSGSFVYGGTEKAAGGFEADTFVIEGNAYTVSGLTAEATGTDADTYPVEVRGTAVVKDAAGNDVTAQFDVNVEDGSLTIDKRPVVITVASAEKTYGADDPVFAAAEMAGVAQLEQSGPVGEELAGVDLSVTRDNATDNTVKKHEKVLNIGKTADELNAEYANYAFTVIPGDFTIHLNTAELTVSAENVERMYDGTPYGVVPEASVEGATILYMDEAGNYTLAECPTQTDAGVLTVNFQASLEGYATAFGSAAVTISKRPVAFVGESGERTYNGSAYNLTDVTVNTAEGQTLVQGHKANVTASAQGMLPGAYPGMITAGDAVRITDANGRDVTGSYDVTTAPGTLTITGIATPILITAASGSKVYDGVALTDAGFTFTEHVLLEGDSLEADVEGSAVNVSDAGVNTVKSYKVMRGGQDVTAAYTFDAPVEGKLTILPRSVTLTSASAEKEYDGTALTNRLVTESQDGQDAEGRLTYGFVSGEGATYDVTGSQTAVGGSDNEFTYTLNKGTLAENYDITLVEGILTVTANTKELRIASGSESWVYDGQSHSHPVYTVMYGGHEVTANADGGYTLPTGDQLTISGAPVATDVADTQDAKENNTFTYTLENADQYTGVSTEFGTVTVTRRPVTINVNTRAYGYDATAKTVADETTQQEYTVVKPEPNEAAGLLNGDTEKLDVVYDANGAQSKALVGTYEATVSPEGVNILRDADNADVTDNYDVRVNPGTLSINDGTPESPVDQYVVTKTHTEKAGGYNLGEAVEFTITATNIYDQTKRITLEEMDGVTLAQSVFDDVLAGETVSTTATYTITEADILAGRFVNTVTATFDVKSFQAADTVTTAATNARLTVAKETVSTPANGMAYALGETITYRIAVTNDGNVTVNEIVVTDTVEGYDALRLNENDLTLAPGASSAFEFTHVVTEQDILAGTVVNNATATGTSPEPGHPVPEVEPGHTEDPTEAPNPSFTLEKTLTNLPGKGYFTLGEEAAFDIAVTNDGNLTLSDISVHEQLESAVILEGEGYTVSDNTAHIATLPVGEVVIVKAAYTITEADLGAELVNIVTATGVGPVEPGEPAPGEEAVPTDDVTDVTGIKTWDDAGNAYATRPDAIMVNLLADGVEVAEQRVTADMGWVYAFTALPAHTADGAEIVYTVAEDPVVGYDAAYTEDGIVNTLQTYGVTVNYWLNNVGGMPAADSFHGTYRYGQPYNIASPAVLGYNVNQERAVGTVLGDVVIDVIYTSAEFTIAVHYVYQDGTEALTTYRDTLLYGEGFYVATPALAGYTPNIRMVAGNMEARHMSYTVIYVPDDAVVTIDEYGVPLGLGNMVMNVGDCIE